MAIRSALVNVTEIARSVEFYSRFLGGELVGEATDDRAVLDLVTATIELTRVDDAVPPTWQDDDQNLGFRHIGFKVAEVDPLVAELKAAAVPFRLDPLDAVGGVRIAFFFDPDGTILEIVEGQLQYHDVADPAGVAAERALGTPARPRFDHVGVTIRDLATTEEFYRPFGFARIGTLLFEGDPRGFRADYLKGGDSVLEVFTFDVEVFASPTRTDALGFVAAELSSGTARLMELSAVGTVGERTVFADADTFTFTVGR